jgi:translation initiation factor 3 subunit M
MTQLEHKIRLLTFASLGFKHVGHDLPYSKVAESLQVDIAEVEKWAIDGKNRHSAPLGYVYPFLA